MKKTSIKTTQIKFCTVAGECRLKAFERQYARQYSPANTSRDLKISTTKLLLHF